MTFPDEYRLILPPKLYNDFTSDLLPEAEEYVKLRNAIYERINNDDMYIKFVDGDRKGSIARIRFNKEKYASNAFAPCKIGRGRNEWDYVSRTHTEKYRLENTHFLVVAYWDKPRKNKIEVSLSRDYVFLPNYKGPTIYEMFDKKAAKEKALENPNQKDIDGNILTIGDKVLYINARYGSAFELCHGTVKEFKASVDSRKKEIATIIEQDGNGVLSQVNNPKTMIWKKYD